MEHALMTQADYARYRGVTPASVHAAIKAGRISIADGKIDPVKADLEWDQNTNHMRRENAIGHQRLQEKEESPFIRHEQNGNAIANEFMTWKIRRERAEALRAELAQEQAAGSLYSKDAADRAAKTMARILRDQLLSIGSRISAELATLSDPAAIERQLNTEIRKALEAVERTALESDHD